MFCADGSVAKVVLSLPGDIAQMMAQPEEIVEFQYFMLYTLHNQNTIAPIVKKIIPHLF